MDDRGAPRPRRPRRDNPWTNLVFGLTVLACGVLFWLDHLGRINAREYLSWWPAALVAFGLAHFLQRQWTGGAVWIAVGAFFLAPLLGVHFVSVRKVLGLWPLLISAAGVTLVIQAIRPAARGNGMHVLAVMAGNVRRLGGQEFVGGDAIAVMGGCEIDLGSAHLTGEGVIDVLAFWGGIEIRVPRGWRVVSRTTAILGGYADHTDGGTEGSPQLVIRGSIIMGGVDVKNSRDLPA
jgi:hypothetical protein